MSGLRLSCKKYAHIILLAVIAALVIFGAAIVFARSQGGPVINEVCSSNVACCMDDKGEYPDWIEIYNPTAGQIDLSGFIVNKTSDLSKEKYVIADGIILAPGAFYLFDPGFPIPSEGCHLNLLDKNDQYVDRVDIPGLKYDTTYSRLIDGEDKWGIRTATPGYSNTDGEDVAPVIEGEVLPSAESGFYDDEFDLKLVSSNPGRSVYYTTDGTDPRINGKLYEGPIRIYDRSGEDNIYSAIGEVSEAYMDKSTALPSYPVDKCTVVNAVSCDLLGRYTDVCTFSYFVGYGAKDAYKDMTVVSVAGTPEDLFSHEKGIMVLGRDYDEYVEAGSPEDYGKSNANFTRRGRASEREVNIDIFGEDHKLTKSVKAGMRIKGLSSRWDVQKSFSVIFRRPYGGNYKEAFSAGGKDFDLHSFALDKGGQDTGSKMMDVIMDTCMSGSSCLTRDSIPCCLFLNGEYWGFYRLAERFDRSFVSDKYGVAKDDVEFVEPADIEGVGWNEDNFDRESLLEYYAANIIVAHDGDWPEFNVRFWKTSTDEGGGYGDGKLRPVIFDMNSYCMKEPDYDVMGFMLESFYPFIKLMEDDEDFAGDLAKKIDSMSADEFEKDKVLTLIDEMYDKNRAQMILDRMRYSDCSKEEAASSFDENVGILRDFFKNRWEYLDREKEKYLDGK